MNVWMDYALLFFISLSIFCREKDGNLGPGLTGLLAVWLAGFMLWTWICSCLAFINHFHTSYPRGSFTSSRLTLFRFSFMVELHSG